MSTQTLPISVVLATFNRAASVQRLLTQLAAQTFDPRLFEVVVVDDGSADPVAPALERLSLPYALRVFRQANGGAAAARHHGVTAARGELLIVLDDDMQVPPHFIAAHARCHAGRGPRVVLGRIRLDESSPMPLHERFHATMLDRFARDVAAGRVRPQGMHLFTGNVSLPRAAYLAVGGFDLTLRRSEDVELGIRLEKAGLTFEFCDEASTVHSSDHASQARWLETALIYGIYDSRIARKHQERAVSPWRRLLEANLLAKPFLLLSVVTPHTAGYVVRAAVAVVNRIDRAGHQRLAVTGLTVAFTMQYFRGVRREAGSLRHVITDLRRYVLA